MEEYGYLNNLLVEICDAKESNIINETIVVKDLSMKHLAESLIKIGKVVKEDLDSRVYIATIPAGFFRMNYAVVALKLSEKTLMVAAYANEGLIKQHTSEGAINEIKRSIEKYLG